MNALDVSAVGGTNKFIKQISEANGKISATAGTVDTTVTSGSSNLVTSGAVFTAIQNAGTNIPEADTYGQVYISDASTYGNLYLSKYGRIVKIDFMINDSSSLVDIGDQSGRSWYDYQTNVSTSGIITSAWRPAYTQNLMETGYSMFSDRPNWSTNGREKEFSRYVSINTNGNINIYIVMQDKNYNYMPPQTLYRFSGFYMCASS